MDGTPVGLRRFAAAVVVLLATASASAPATAPASVPGRTNPVRAAAGPPPPTTITIVATGDVLIHQRGPLVAGAAAVGRASGTAYDFRPVFADIAPLVAGADLAVCHLETPVATQEGPFSGYPSFSVQPQIIEPQGWDDAIDRVGGSHVVFESGNDASEVFARSYD